MALLILNAGSSNLKASIYRVKNGSLEEQKPIWKEKISWKEHDLNACKEQILVLLKKLPHKVDLVGHRIVHGGDKYIDTTLIDETVISELKELIELAPLHEPVSIKGIECVNEIFPDIKQFAVFDTAFHADMPDSSKIYPLPYEWYEKLGIKRFGFHGISHKYVSRKAAQILERKLEDLNIISCHLGNGASLCAVRNGKSIMTTMGFTPLEGLVMGTRSGSIDPGIILHVLKGENYDIDSLEDVLNESCGLKGICGFSDMKDIEREFEKGDGRAKLALDIYVNRLAGSIASLMPLLGGLDVLVFTGGVGENSAKVREATCRKLEFAGIKINSDLNDSIQPKLDSVISLKQSSADVLVIESKEDLAIAEECLGAGGLTAST